MKVIVGKACHTFGELLQGQINGRPFLVSLPIQHFAHAIYTPGFSNSIQVVPKKEKALQALLKVKERYSLSEDGVVSIENSLPEGKGFATSTADMLAAIRAYTQEHHIFLTPLEEASILGQIEPTDGTMFECLVAFYHREGQPLEELGYLPPLTVIGVDRGGKVDTVDFNRRDIPYTAEEEKEYQALLIDLKAGLQDRDANRIGRVSTRSAEMHQKRLPHPYFPWLVEISEKAGGAGVAITHSGTLAGILLDERQSSFTAKANRIEERLKEWGCPVYRFQVGARVEEGVQPWICNPFAGAEPNSVL